MPDSTGFFVTWWYSGDSSWAGAKEMALYMQYGIDKYKLRTAKKL